MTQFISACVEAFRIVTVHGMNTFLCIFELRTQRSPHTLTVNVLRSPTRVAARWLARNRLQAFCEHVPAGLRHTLLGFFAKRC